MDKIEKPRRQARGFFLFSISIIAGWRACLATFGTFIIRLITKVGINGEYVSNRTALSGSSVLACRK